jgi:electron transfer flavoprotein beta subunit
MNIAVCVKQTYDTKANITLDDKGLIEENGIVWILNPYDEYAIEEALLLKESHGGEVTAISFGGDVAREAIISALSMGADQAILIRQDEREIDEWVEAEVLGSVLKDRAFDIILTGRLSIDNGSSQVPARLAESLGIPLVSGVTGLHIEGERAIAVHDVDGGKETVEVPLPAVITAHKGLNEPRYPTTMGIMKAKKKPIEALDIAELNLGAGSLQAKMRRIEYELPAERKAGIILEGDAAQKAKALVSLLQTEKAL